MKSRCALLLLLASASSLVLAQDAPPTVEEAGAPNEPVAGIIVSDDIETVEADEVAAAFARMDSDRDGQLSLQEFERGISRPYGSSGEGVVYQRLPARFRALDLDASGYLEAAEFPALAQRWRGPGPAPTELAPADRSGDGRIDFREFAYLHAPPEASAPDESAEEAASLTR